MSASLSAVDNEFRQVIDSFRSRAKLNQHELILFKLTTVADLQIALQEVQDKLESRKSLVALKRLQPFIDTFLDFGSVVEVFLNTSDLVAFIWVSTRSGLLIEPLF